MSAAISPQAIIVMGVAGAGKTTVGQALAAALDWPFYDGDDFHPPANVAKMGAGVPLTDADRAPWLAALHALLAARLGAGQPLVLACSALKAAYRRQLAGELPGVALLYLQASPALIAQRLQHRPGHFMPAALAESQFAALEPPAGVLTLDAARTVAELVAQARAALGV